MKTTEVTTSGFVSEVNKSISRAKGKTNLQERIRFIGKEIAIYEKSLKQATDLLDEHKQTAEKAILAAKTLQARWEQDLNRPTNSTIFKRSAMVLGGAVALGIAYSTGYGLPAAIVTGVTVALTACNQRSKPQIAQPSTTQQPASTLVEPPPTPTVKIEAPTASISTTPSSNSSPLPLDQLSTLNPESSVPNSILKPSSKKPRTKGVFNSSVTPLSHLDTKPESTASFSSSSSSSASPTDSKQNPAKKLVGSVMLPGLGIGQSSLKKTAPNPKEESKKASEKPQPNFRFEFDVVGSNSQNDDFRGKSACTSITGEFLLRMTKTAPMTHFSIDECIVDGMESHRQTLNISEDEWETMTPELARKKLGPISVGKYLASSKSLRLRSDLKSLSGTFTPQNSSDPMGAEEFKILFGSLIAAATPEKPAMAFVVVGTTTSAETYGLRVERNSKNQLTYKFFNSHGTDLERDDMEGRTTHAARLNVFKTQEEFYTYLSTRFSAVSSNGLQVSLYPCEPI